MELAFCASRHLTAKPPFGTLLPCWLRGADYNTLFHKISPSWYLRLVTWHIILRRYTDGNGRKREKAKAGGSSRHRWSITLFPVLLAVCHTFSTIQGTPSLGDNFIFTVIFISTHSEFIFMFPPTKSRLCSASLTHTAPTQATLFPSNT